MGCRNARVRADPDGAEIAGPSFIECRFRDNDPYARTNRIPHRAGM